MSLGLFRARRRRRPSYPIDPQSGKLIKTEAVAIAPPAPVSPTLDIRVTSAGEVVFLVRNDQVPGVVAFDPDQLGPVRDRLDRCIEDARLVREAIAAVPAGCEDLLDDAQRAVSCADADDPAAAPASAAS